MTKNRWKLAIGCLLVGVFGGAAGAQVVQRALSTSYLNTGLFALAPGDTAYFHVSLDDVRSGQPARVKLQFFDEAGEVVSSDETVLAGGQSTTLRMLGPGLFRAHAEMIESSLQLTGRRSVVGTVEVFDLTAEKKPSSCTIHHIPGVGDGGKQ